MRSSTSLWRKSKPKRRRLVPRTTLTSRISTQLLHAFDSQCALTNRCVLLCAQRVPLGQRSWPSHEPDHHHRVNTSRSSLPPRALDARHQWNRNILSLTLSSSNTQPSEPSRLNCARECAAPCSRLQAIMLLIQVKRHPRPQRGSTQS